jgi:DNA-binding FadR family transcriptional regulator
MLPERLAQEMQKLIVEKKLKPGDLFPTESALMERYGMGRSSIREAIKLLVAQNVLEIRRGNGTYICQRTGMNSDPLGLKFADQSRLLLNLFETRLLVEPRIARLAAQRATPEDLAKMEECLHAFGDCPPNDSNRFSSLDIDFHTILADCTKNEVLYRFMPSICESIARGASQTVNNPASHRKAAASHAKIFQALKDKDPKKAGRAAAQHIKQTARDAGIDIMSNIFLGGSI